MKITIILGHPTKNSLNHAIAKAVYDSLLQTGHSVVFHDLYAEGFDPLLTPEEIARDADLPLLIKRHCDEIVEADGIVIIHPNWWGQPPAIVKGWIDRVIRPGVAYEFREGDSGDGVPCGLLKLKNALIFNTSNTPAAREHEVFGDPLELIWKNCVFGLCGVTNVQRKTFCVVVTSTDNMRKEWIQEAQAIAVQYFGKG
jgi:NAD(P)H dehydrogenase (quinone)